MPGINNGGVANYLTLGVRMLCSLLVLSLRGVQLPVLNLRLSLRTQQQVGNVDSRVSERWLPEGNPWAFSRKGLACSACLRSCASAPVCLRSWLT